MTVHLEWQSPYPRRRHVRPPDPISGAEWLREIGATATGRRRSDGQPLLARRGDTQRGGAGSSGAAWLRPDGRRVRTRRLASVGAVLPVTPLNAWFVLLAVLLLVLLAVTVWALWRSRRLRDRLDIATANERYQRTRADRLEEAVRRSLRPQVRRDVADDPAGDLLGLGDPPPEDALAIFTADMGALTARIGLNVTKAFEDVTEVLGRHHEGRRS